MRDNGGYHDYHDLVLQLRGDVTAWGLSHTTAYKWAHSVDNVEDRGAGQADFQTEINGRTDNRFDRGHLRGQNDEHSGSPPGEQSDLESADWAWA